MEYIKHFNQDSENYLRFRPDYPHALYDYLAELVTEHQVAWDCGTGNGQAAIYLAKYFKTVIASDINPKPLESAPQSTNIKYICCPAEKTPIKDKSVNLITIAQALHWFDFDLFYKEVRRVCKGSATIAAWCYSLGYFNSAIDPIIFKLYEGFLGNEYWPARRGYIDQQYLGIPFPFKKIVPPSFSIEKKINLSELLGYLNTWSAVKEYELRNNANPINLVAQELESAWGDPLVKHKIVWPIHLLVGTVE